MKVTGIGWGAIADEPAPGFEVSVTGVLLFLVVGLALVGLMWAVRYGVRVSAASRRRKKQLITTLRVVDTLVGLLYVVAAVPMLFSGRPEYSPYFAVLLVAAVLWVAWIAARDLVHGVFFKGGRVCREGDEVQLADVRGEVVRLGYRTLTVRTAEGEAVLLPYSRISRESVTRRPREAVTRRHAFVVEVPAGLALPEASARARLAAFNHHWASMTHDAEIEVVSGRELRVAVHALDPLQGPAIEASVRAALR